MDVRDGGVFAGCNQRPYLQSRTKPTIYNTTDGQVIVEDEFLNFLAVKIKTMAQEEIILSATSTFGSEWIEASKKVLFELCPDTKQRQVTYKGAQKDVNNVKACLRVLNECGVNIPRFVSHNLDDLPPVTFNNLDVSSLLGKLEGVYSEVCVCALRHSMKMKADIEDELRAVSVTLGARVAALESRAERQSGGPEMETTRNAGMI